MQECQAEAIRERLEALHAESFAWALNCCRRDRMEAEDVLQTAYVKVLGGQARFGERSALRTWWFGVIRRTAAERRRRTRLGARILEALHLTGWKRSPVVTPEDQFAADETHRALHRALSQLATRQRELLLLVFAHEMTVEDAGEVMGISAGTARRHYDRGKARLRGLLAPTVKP
ncbi:MAG: sigma-70 family RNA polymerase sigma factor [Acidobacteriota bacterium]